MKNLKTLLITVLLVLTLVFSGCTSKSKTENDPAPTNIVFGENVVAIAGDYEITMDELVMYIDMIAPYIQSQTGSAPGWENILVDGGKTARDVIIQYAIEEAKYQQILLDAVKNEGLYDDEANALFAQEYLETAFPDEGTYEEFLTEHGFSDEAYRKYIASTGAYNAICPEEKAAEIYKNSYMTVKHILVLFEGRDSEETAYNEATLVYERAANGEDFEALITEFNEDPGQSVETGYTFTEGTMVPEFYEASLALAEGEISAPVKTTYGYHVIKRYPLADVDTAQYQESINAIMNNEFSKFLNGDTITAMVEENVLHINDDLVREVDLSRYTTGGEVTE